MKIHFLLPLLQQEVSRGGICLLKQLFIRYIIFGRKLIPMTLTCPACEGRAG
jgi:hypothetical protein